MQYYTTSVSHQSHILLYTAPATIRARLLERETFHLFLHKDKAQNQAMMNTIKWTAYSQTIAIMDTVLLVNNITFIVFY